jgi:putative acetyltransferase
MMRIIQGDLCDRRVVGLLHIHLTRARAETAPGSAHALDLTELQSPDISFWTIWDGIFSTCAYALPEPWVRRVPAVR